MSIESIIGRKLYIQRRREIGGSANWAVILNGTVVSRSVSRKDAKKFADREKKKILAGYINNGEQK